MTPELQALLRTSLHRRAGALAKITAPEMGNNDTVTAKFVLNVVTVAAVLHGPKILEQVLQLLQGHLLEKHNVCRVCGENPLDHDGPAEGSMCGSCWADFEQIEQDLKLLDQPTRGTQ